jgi:hypothetical protein
MSAQVHEMIPIDFIPKKSCYNELTAFMDNWKPKPNIDYKGYLKNFLETINKNKSKYESMNDSIIPIFLLTLSICLFMVGLIVSIVRKSPVYISIVAAAVILIIINVMIEVKKRGEVQSASQDIKVQAEILKNKTEGQLEITIIKPNAKGCYVFSAHGYIIKLILKYQSINQNTNINMFFENDPFAKQMNTLYMNPNPEMPNNTYDIPMQEIELYEGGGKKQEAFKNNDVENIAMKDNN